jgi:small-conductance mechanosensitive channel
LSWGLGRFGGFLGGVLSVFGMYLLQAALVKAVQDVRDGRVDLDLRQTVEAALPSVLPVAIASVLAAIAITIGFFVFIVPGLILATFLSLIVPWIVIGGSEALASFGRSWRTVRGNGWHVFGTYVVVFLLLILADIIIALILSFLPATAANFLAEIISGTLVAPFIAAVVTLVYYRLTAARDQPANPPWPGS